MLALRSALRQRNWFTDSLKEPNMAQFLDLVALGTVADVVPLDKNNRILVEQGLRRIRRGECCKGIQALIKVANRSAANLSASDIGFALGPRLNAAKQFILNKKRRFQSPKFRRRPSPRCCAPQGKAQSPWTECVKAFFTAKNSDPNAKKRLFLTKNAVSNRRNFAPK